MRSRVRRHGGARGRAQRVGRDDEAFRLVWFGREGCRWWGLGIGNWRIGLWVKEPVWPILRPSRARGEGFLRGGSGCIGCLLWWYRVGLGHREGRVRSWEWC